MSWLLFDSFDGAPPVATPGTGDAGVATLGYAAENGATVTLSWLTDVLSAWDGTEQRISLRAMPRQRYEVSSILTDAHQRALHGALSRLGAGAPLYTLPLHHESLTVVSSTSTTITVHDLTLCDWATSGQRVLVAYNGTYSATAVVQSAAGNVLTVDTDLSATALAGAQVMPAMSVRLDADVGLGRYLVNAGTAQLRAIADRVRYGSAGTAGVGASVTTFDSLPLWTWGVQSDGLTDQPLYTGAELVDLGGAVSAIGDRTAPQWGRTLLFASHRRADWQWLKAFLHAVRGRWKAFLVPTGRPDLVPDSYVGDELIISGADYVADWYPSLAHRRLWLTYADGTGEALGVTSAEVVTGTTQRLYLSASLASLPVRVEFLETCRLEEDEIAVTCGDAYDATMRARVVQS
jgi:hypothetical protein